MMRYSCALALMLALSLAVCSQGFRLKRKAGDRKHIAEVNFQQEQPSLAQEEVEEEVHDETHDYDEDEEYETTDEEPLEQVQEDTEDAEESSFVQNVSDPVTSIKVAYGTSLSDAAWKSRRDFVVYVNAAGYCCTGTISGNVVLTAAHCVKGKPKSQLSVKTSSKSKISVTSVSVHKDYNSKTNAYDVALLWLKSSHSAKKKVRLSSRTLSVGNSLAIAGFGQTQSIGCGKLHDSGWLKSTTCGSRHSSIACAGSGSASRTGSCGGDSGAPWYRVSSDWSTFYIVGVNSFGTSARCGDSSMQSGLIRTKSVMSWIKSKTTQFLWSSSTGQR